jgi:hypothetical protein
MLDGPSGDAAVQRLIGSNPFYTLFLYKAGLDHWKSVRVRAWFRVRVRLRFRCVGVVFDPFFTFA